MKRQTLDQLSEIGQDVGQLLSNPKASKKMNSDSEELTQRWDSLVQRLEDSSNQVPCNLGGIFHHEVKSY